MDDKKSLLSAEELNALIGSWGASTDEHRTDKMFPLRFWFLAVLTLLGGTTLLLNARDMAQTLTSDPNFIERLQNMLYFRGWFVCSMVAIGAFVYIKDKYIPLYSFGLLIISIVNFLFDMVLIFPERLSNPTTLFTINLMLRLIAIWCLYLNLRNCNNIPNMRDRFSIKFSFSKH
jgi:hypothetical protein